MNLGGVHGFLSGQPGLQLLLTSQLPTSPFGRTLPRHIFGYSFFNVVFIEWRYPDHHDIRYDIKTSLIPHLKAHLHHIFLGSTENYLFFVNWSSSKSPWGIISWKIWYLYQTTNFKWSMSKHQLVWMVGGILSSGKWEMEVKCAHLMC